jgi:WD40 repeat protein
MIGWFRYMAYTRDLWTTPEIKVVSLLLGMCVAARAGAPLTARGDEPPAKPLPPTVRCLAYSPDGQGLAIAGNADKRGLLVVWDPKRLRPRFRHREPIGFRSVAFSPDGRLIALARDAPEVLLLNAQTGEPSKSIARQSNNVSCLAFMPDGKKLITAAADRTVRIWDVATGKEEAVVGEHPETVVGLDVSRDGRLIATADGRGGTARLWDLATRQMRYSFGEPFMFTPHVRFSPDGRLLAVSCWRGTVTLLDTATHKVRMQFRSSQGAYWSDFSPDQKWLAIALSSPTVNVHPIDPSADGATRAKVGALLARFRDDSYANREAAQRELAALGMAAEPQLRAGTKSDSAEVRWRCRKLLARLSQPESAVRLEGHKGEIMCVAFSPEGRQLASGDDHGTVKLWSVGDWKVDASIAITEATARRD